LKNVFLQGNFCSYWLLTLDYILVFFFNVNWTRISGFLYMRVLEIIWQIFFCSFSYFFVKRPDNGSGCPDSKVDSSGRPFSLFGRACLWDLLRGTTSGSHLSFVQTVNPVGLYRFPPRCSPSHFIFFLSSCAFFLIFMCASHVHLSFLQFISTPGMFLYPFTDLF